MSEKIVQLNEGIIKSELKELVRGSVEETLNELLNKKAYVHIENWRNRPLQGGRYPYVYVDGIYLRRNWGGEHENVAILVVISVNEDGFREVLGAAEGMKEYKASWVSFFRWLHGRGLDGVELIVGDKCLGMLEAVGKVKIVAKMLKAIHAQESKKASHESDAFMQSKIQNRQTSARFADFGTPEGTRTPNPQNRNLMLYPLSHWRICNKYYSRTLQQCKAFILIYRKKRRAENLPDVWCCNYSSASFLASSMIFA